MVIKNLKILYIGNKLSKHGYTATSIETLGPLLNSENYEVFYSSSFKNKIIRFFDIFFKTIVFAPRVNYILIDTYSTQNFWFAFIVSQLCRLFNKPYLPILRGGDLPKRLNKSPFFSKLIFSNAYFNVSPSNYSYCHFKELGVPNLIVIPNTIEIKKYPFYERKIEKPKILWVRSLTSIYNPKMAIDVLEQVKRSYPEAELCIVGPEKGMTIEELSSYAATKKVDVIFTGKLSKPEWTKLAEQFDVFINTTHFDNTPVSVIEAMALGLPVVSTNVGGIPYLLTNNDTALLVQDGAVDEMTLSIIKLINNPVLASQLSQNGRKLVEQFDWNIVKNQWKEILK
jgi:L-malate glycosyltransferase